MKKKNQNKNELPSRKLTAKDKEYLDKVVERAFKIVEESGVIEKMIKEEIDRHIMWQIKKLNVSDAPTLEDVIKEWHDRV